MEKTESQKRRGAEAIKVLQEKGARGNCPRCGNSAFDLIGESFISIQENPGTLVIGGPLIPVFVTACTRCGFVSQHAQGPLGLIKEASK